MFTKVYFPRCFALEIMAIHRECKRDIKVFIAPGRPMPFTANLSGVEYDGIMSVTSENRPS